MSPFKSSSFILISKCFVIVYNFVFCLFQPEQAIAYSQCPLVTGMKTSFVSDSVDREIRIEGKNLPAPAVRKAKIIIFSPLVAIVFYFQSVSLGKMSDWEHFGLKPLIKRY